MIHAHNVLAHVADLHGVVQGFRTLLKDDGVVVVETPYVKDLVDHVEFDTIYHEHLCYYSLTALDQLARRHGLKTVDVSWVPIHGGSLRVTFARRESAADVSRRRGQASGGGTSGRHGPPGVLLRFARARGAS